MMNNVSKTISWAHFTLNPVKGLCPVGCSYCYARRMYGRNCNATFRDKTIRYDDSVFQGVGKSKPGDRIFVGSTIDLFHPLVSMWTQDIINSCSYWPDRTFIFLTKCPANLPKEWPDNCWVGLSVDGTENAPLRRIYNGLDKTQARVKFISFEPLLADPKLDYRDLEWAGINWVITGQRTPIKKTTMPKIEWIKEIVEACDKAGIPVFQKNNLSKLLGELRQEFPPAPGDKLRAGARSRQKNKG